MRGERKAPAILKFGLGVGIGYALYRLLGLAGGGGGFGPGGAGLGPGGSGPGSDGSGAGAPATEPPARPLDSEAVQVRVRPSPNDPTRVIIEVEGRIVTVGELVERVNASGRRDVTVTVASDTRPEAWNELHEALNFLGIQLGPKSQLPPRRCKIRIASGGISVDGRAVTVEEAIAACRSAKDVEVLVTGGARDGDYEDLEAALRKAGIRWVKVTKSTPATKP